MEKERGEQIVGEVSALDAKPYFCFYFFLSVRA